MIRVMFKQQLDEKSFREKRRITLLPIGCKYKLFPRIDK